MERDPLLERLADASPVRDTDVGGVATAALIESMARSVAAGSPARPRGRLLSSRRTAALVAAGLAALLCTTAFAFVELSARTGWFGNPDFTEEDGTEWLRSDAADFGAVARSLVPHEIPLPPGLGWEQEVVRQVELGREQPGLIQETGVRSSFAFYARCAWVKTWVDAHRAGDARLRERATRELAGARDWAALAAVDGGGVRDAFATMVAAPAARGEAGPVRAELRNNCSGFDVRSGS